PFEWVHVQLHQQKGMISLSPPTICNSAKKPMLFAPNGPTDIVLHFAVGKPSLARTQNNNQTIH
ncbi:hypothetical protein, partial [Salmonella enterica]|uniref:hypothetical protein n=1 Tax=Salmonella enterica TaxID=28901 RepID=UPI001C4EA52F